MQQWPQSLGRGAITRIEILWRWPESGGGEGEERASERERERERERGGGRRQRPRIDLTRDAGEQRGEGPPPSSTAAALGIVTTEMRRVGDGGWQRCVLIGGLARVCWSEIVRVPDAPESGPG